MTMSFTVYDKDNIRAYWASDGTIGISTGDLIRYGSFDMANPNNHVSVKPSEIKIALDNPNSGIIYEISEQRPSMFYEEADVKITTKDNEVEFQVDISLEPNGSRMPSNVVVPLDVLQEIFEAACTERDYFMKETCIPPVLGTNCLEAEKDVI